MLQIFSGSGQTLEGSVLISSFLQPFIGGPGQDVSSELKQRYFSLTPKAWEAEFLVNQIHSSLLKILFFFFFNDTPTA